MAFHHMVFHAALLTHRRKEAQLNRSKFGKPVFPCFSLRGKGLRVRKVAEGKGKTIYELLFGLLSDRFLGLLHGLKLMIAVSSLVLFLL